MKDSARTRVQNQESVSPSKAETPDGPKASPRRFAWTHKAVLCLAALPGISAAHGVSVWAESEDNQVRVEGFFTNGARLTQGIVEVLACDALPVHAGTLNQFGYFRFQPKARQELLIRLRIDDAHNGEFRLSPDQLPQSTPKLPGTACR